MEKSMYFLGEKYILFRKKIYTFFAGRLHLF
ncbi:hypothetical protein HMPREF9431_01615 [Segatella oulorum F0390]|uniref:Uncharacterized protein n=1 Tax=Segatella oulorum F0390 TaxID=702438 RepID=G1WCR4_9BACT|nr:hypothetical protein HMPREF9431_01615 [Segatella oulorum F0390]